MLEFLCNEEAWDLRAGAVLPDEVYVLQFSYGGSGQQPICAIRGGGLPGDSGASRVAQGGWGR